MVRDYKLCVLWFAGLVFIKLPGRRRFSTGCKYFADIRRGENLSIIADVCHLT